ncbi:hypothetical protein L2737_02205 [Shewanella electrodiphila]|uniref:Glycosyltransferase n=1 Tax=Shewanella electrodiphila TaxID=934143 RepID=A0ABT0KJY0_9GAMM|nr:hypothetical protein [Shewanella electrodiphila]MCL1044145.1 hypothetical protein [Shewanella electrodiphila]
MKKVICLGNGPVMSFTPYMAKLANVLCELGIATNFVTWVREDDVTTAKDPDNVETTILYKSKETKVKFILVLKYFLWMIKVFLFASLSKEKYFICSRFENAFPLFLVSLFKNISYLYADRDNLHSTYKWPSIIKKVIYKIECLVAARAKIHLVPGLSRNFTSLNNVRIISNKPSRSLYNKAKLIFNSRDNNLDESYVVYINGWITKNRGLHQISDAIVSKYSKKVKFLIAGDATSMSNELLTLDNVNYLGRLSNEEALSFYFESHLVISLYDPSIKINRLAEPNKWWDCVLSQTPFISNFGVSTVERYNDLVEFHLIDYKTPYSLFEAIEKVSKINRTKKPVKLNCFKFWDDEMKDIIMEFID